MLGFLSAAATDPTTPRSAAVAISSDKPLWISFRFICWFCVGFVLVLFLHFGFGSGNRCWPRGMALLRNGRAGVNHVAWANLGQQILGIVAVRRIFHRVQVIEVAEELIEPMNRGKEFIEVTKVILAELPGGVTHGLERRGDGRRCIRHADRRTGLADGR